MIFNLESTLYVAHHPVWAIGWRMRLRGMIARRFDPEKMDAMIFENCGSVHSCWMSIPLDLLFLDRGRRVVRLYRSLMPWRLAFGGRCAVAVIELPAGAIERSRTKIGDILNLNSSLTPEAVEKIRREVILKESMVQSLMAGENGSGCLRGK